jgi:hypothetical protein
MTRGAEGGLEAGFSHLRMPGLFVLGDAVLPGTSKVCTA